MSKTQAITNRTTKPKPTTRANRAPTSRALLPPAIASRDTIEALIELMSHEGAHRMPGDVTRKLGYAGFLDWHAALIVRSAADAGLPEATVLRVLVELARELADGTHALYAPLDDGPSNAKLLKCEALLAGKIDVNKERNRHELLGMIYAPEELGSGGAFLCSLLHAALELAQNQDEREPGASREIQRAAQHMVRDVFGEKSARLQIHSKLSEYEATEPAREATEPFVEHLRTKLAAALAAHNSTPSN